MSTRSVSSVAGVALIVVGFAMLFVPGLSALFPANELYLTLVGLGFALQTVRVVRGRLNNPYEQTETADPEISQELPTPGEFAAAAVDAGIDREDVVELTGLFERVRYGSEAATADREARALDALRRIDDQYGGEDA